MTKGSTVLLKILHAKKLFVVFDCITINLQIVAYFSGPPRTSTVTSLHVQNGPKKLDHFCKSTTPVCDNVRLFI